MKQYLVVFGAVVLLLCGLHGVAAAQEKCPFSVSGAIGAGDATQSGRLRNGAPSVCTSPKAVPDLQNTKQKRRFDAYTLKNRSRANACITATVSATTAGVPVASAAYLGAFDGANPQVSYLGDSGAVLGSPVAYSFLVPALETFVVTVNEIGNGGGTYDLTIGDCGSIVATSMTPNAGPITGGTAITISGSGFVAGASVTIGGAPALDVSVAGEGTITATTPPGVAGSADVVVTNPDGAASTLPAAFVYAGPTATSLGLASSANPAVIGQSITFTATATSGAGSPTGAITFKDGATTLGSASASASGVATFATSALAIGTHAITAEYAGTTTFAPATSAVVSQVVTLGKTTTSMVASMNPVLVGNTVTFDIAVSAAAPSTGKPTGTIRVAADGVAVGTAAALDATGKATISTASLTAGTHAVIATYSGDTMFSTSTSAPLMLVVAAGGGDGGTTSSSSGGSTASSSGTSGGEAGTSSSSSSASSGGNADDGVANGGGGCDCRTTPHRGAAGIPAVLALALATLLTGLRRRRTGPRPRRRSRSGSGSRS